MAKTLANKEALSSNSQAKEVLASNSQTKEVLSVSTLTKESLNIDGLFGNMKGFWRFNEGNGTTALDSSGNRNNGVITWATYVTGKYSSGLDFDGASGNTLITDADVIQNIFDSGGSISVWINPRSDGENNVGRILDKDNGTNGWGMYAVASDGTNIKIGFFIRFTGGDRNWRSETIVQLNSWNHISITYNSDTDSSTPTIKVNNIASSLTVIGPGTGTRKTDVGQNLYIGNRSNGDRTFDGIIDEVMLYSPVLTDAQNTFIYENPTLFKEALNSNTLTKEALTT